MMINQVFNCSHLLGTEREQREQGKGGLFPCLFPSVFFATGTAKLASIKCLLGVLGVCSHVPTFLHTPPLQYFPRVSK